MVVTTGQNLLASEGRKRIVGVELENLWKEVLLLIRNGVSEQEYSMWFLPLMPYQLDRGVSSTELTMVVPDEVTYRWIEEKKLRFLKEILDKVFGKGCQLFYRIAQELPVGLQVSLYLWRKQYAEEYIGLAPKGLKYARLEDETIVETKSGRRIERVWQPYLLTVSYYDLTLLQKRVLMEILLQMRIRFDWHQRQDLISWGRFSLKMPFRAFRKKDKKEIFKEIEKLRGRSIRLEYVRHKGLSGTISLPLLATVSMEDDFVGVVVPEETVAVLFYLGNGYTKYELSTGLRLASKYSLRLYELCCHWKDQGGFVLPVSRLYNLFELKPSCREISFLRRKVLEPAREELKGHAEVYFEYSFKTSLEIPFSGSQEVPKGKRGRPSYGKVLFKVISKENLNVPNIKKKKAAQISKL